VAEAARKLLLHSPGAHFELCLEYDRSLYLKIKKNIFGGPSIIFNRLIEHRKSMGPRKVICEIVVGFDANALYVYALSSNMPCGIFVRRKAENNFKG
jgi:hypothetical protein